MERELPHKGIPLSIFWGVQIWAAAALSMYRECKEAFVLKHWSRARRRMRDGSN